MYAINPNQTQPAPVTPFFYKPVILSHSFLLHHKIFDGDFIFASSVRIPSN